MWTLVAVAVAATGAAAQGTCETYAGSACAGVFDWPVFVSSNTTQAAVEAEAAEQVGQLSLAAGLFPDCVPLFLSYLCNTYFPFCDDGAGSAVAVEVPLCLSVCESLSPVCDDLFELGGSEPLDCSEYSEEPVEFDDGRVFECNDLSGSGAVEVSCIPPLAATADGLSCDLVCPLPIFSSGREKKLKDTRFILSYVSFCLSVLTAITWLVFPEKRDIKLVKLEVISIFFVALLTLWSQWVPEDQIKCVDDTTRAGLSEPFCLIQGAGILYFSLTSTFVWGAIAVNLFMLIVREIRDDKTKALVHRVLVAISFGFPAILVLLVVSFDKIKYSSATDYCFVDDQNPAWLDGAFFGHVIGVLVIGNFCVFSVLYKIARTMRRSGRTKGIFVHTRTLLFLMTFDVMFAFVIAFRYVNEELRDDLVRSYTAYFECVGDGGTPGQDCTILEPNYVLYSINSALLGVQGIVSFALFGLTRENASLWRSAWSRRSATSGTSRRTMMSQRTHGANSNKQPQESPTQSKLLRNTPPPYQPPTPPIGDGEESIPNSMEELTLGP